MSRRPTELDFTGDYRRHLAACRKDTDVTDAFPWDLLEGLTEAQAGELAPLLDELHIKAGAGLAARCVLVVDLATDPGICGELSTDWRRFAREMATLDSQGVAAPSVALAALLARAHHGWRLCLHAGDDDPRGSYFVRLAGEEKQFVRAVERFVDCMENLLRRGSGVGVNFHPIALADWWRLRGTELQRCLETDQEAWGAKGRSAENMKRRRRAYTPDSGNRDDEYHSAIYEAFETAATLAKKSWPTPGGVGAVRATKSLFEAAAIPLSDNAIQQRRRRKTE
jgi:hypothetical protein